MKYTFLALFFAFASVAHSQRNGPAIVSPEVHADRTVTFRLAAPKATDVTLTCLVEFLPLLFQPGGNAAAATGPAGATAPPATR